MPVAQLAGMTSGLNNIHLRSLLCAAQHSDDGLTYEDVRFKKKEIIEAECVGLVEFVTPRNGLENVGGLKPAKDYLRDIAETIKRGDTQEAPMGILIRPAGTGKTFLAECFARDCGMNVVEFKNFRDKWVGSTEANLEKILHLLQSLAPIVVLVDEADAALGNRDSGGDSGVDQRVFSKIAAAMGDTANRGRILWILMTSRPDLLPIDLKRQGRCEEHISLFYPEVEGERRRDRRGMARRTEFSTRLPTGRRLRVARCVCPVRTSNRFSFERDALRDRPGRRVSAISTSPAWLLSLRRPGTSLLWNIRSWLLRARRPRDRCFHRDISRSPMRSSRDA
jgi:hypothetical protein